MVIVLVPPQVLIGVGLSDNAILGWVTSVALDDEVSLGSQHPHSTTAWFRVSSVQLATWALRVMIELPPTGISGRFHTTNGLIVVGMGLDESYATLAGRVSRTITFLAV